MRLEKNFKKSLPIIKWLLSVPQNTSLPTSIFVPHIDFINKIKQAKRFSLSSLLGAHGPDSNAVADENHVIRDTDEEDYEDEQDYREGTLQVGFLLRWLPPCEDRRHIRWGTLSHHKKVGLGTL